jgi:hypothetical protein
MAVDNVIVADRLSERLRMSWYRRIEQAAYGPSCGAFADRQWPAADHAQAQA